MPVLVVDELLDEPFVEGLPFYEELAAPPFEPAVVLPVKFFVDVSGGLATVLFWGLAVVFAGLLVALLGLVVGGLEPVELVLLLAGVVLGVFFIVPLF